MKYVKSHIRKVLRFFSRKLVPILCEKFKQSPRQSRKLVGFFSVLTASFSFAELSCQQMTIGKIHCAKLIHENYKYLKRKGMPTEKVSINTG